MATAALPCSRIATVLGLGLLASADLRAQAPPVFERPLRAVHISGNWGANRVAVEGWSRGETEAVIPLDYVEYLRGLHVNWVGISVSLHYDDSLDSTVERNYSPDLSVPTFSDAGLRQLIREFRQHDFEVYLTLAFESIEAAASDARPVQRWQLGDPGDAATGAPADDPMYALPILAENWPWRPDHPDHARFVAEFWRTYTEQAVHFARIAQEMGVRMYSLGTETDRLFRTRSDGYHWTTDFGQELRTMVDGVRSVFERLLTYDMHYFNIAEPVHGSQDLWKDLGLDVVGLSAWIPLADSPPATVLSVEHLRREYERVFREHLVPLAEYNDQPIVFTEYGSNDVLEAPANPAIIVERRFVFSDTNGNGIDDGRETQANIFRALFQTMSRYSDVVHGTFFAAVLPSLSTEATGFFWFFSPENIELAVKVLDGRAINDRFWVLYGGLSDVEYTIEVTDTVTGTSKSYRNPRGSLCGGVDTGGP